MKALATKLLLSVVSLVCVFALLEIGFRVLGLRGAHESRTRPPGSLVMLAETQTIPGVVNQFRPGVQFEMRYDSNPRGYFDENNALSYKINRHGFRGPEFSKQKLDGTFRIVILGDSFAFGEGVRWEDTFSYQLREIFISDAPTRYIEVVNLFVFSRETAYEITYLEHEGATFDPDLVIVVYVMNDANHAGGLDLWDNFREQYEASGLVRRSHFASYVYARVMRHVYGRRYVRGLVDSALSETELWATSMDELSRGAQIAQRMDADFAVVIFPFMYRLDESYPLHDLHDLVRSHCESQEIPVLDLFDAFEGRPYADLWVHPTDQHPNEIGHRIAAEAIAQFLNQSGLLPGPSQAESSSSIPNEAGS